MKRYIACLLIFTAFLVSGCVIRTSSYKVDRVDQEIKGNRGIVVGNLPDLPEDKTNKTRKMYKVEIELPSSLDVETTKELDKDISGNRGYVYKEGVSLKDIRAVELPAPSKTNIPTIVYSKPIVSEKKYRKIEDVYYVVKKGDTLQEISQEFFGTTKQWKKIYEANKNILKSPDKIRPGQKLVIPND